MTTPNGMRILGFCAVFATGARADVEPPYPAVSIESLSTPTVQVVSTDGFEYNAIKGNTYAYTLQIYGDCKEDRDVVAVQGNTPTHPFPIENIDISDLPDPTRFLTSHFATQPDTNLPIVWPLSMRQKVVAACNDMLESKMDDGIPRGIVLSQNWSLGKTYVGSFQGALYCQDPDGSLWAMAESSAGEAYVKCEKYLTDDIVQEVPSDGSGGPRGGVQVIESNLTITPVTTSRQCGITMSGWVRANARDALVTLYYQDNQGGRTPARAVKTDASKRAYFEDFIAFQPVDGGGFIAQPQGAGGRGSFLAPGSDRQIAGSYQLVGTNPEFRSNVEGFAFDCPVQAGKLESKY